MKTRLPPLNAMKSFEAAARLGSMTKAAEELFITQVAVSNQIANLEQSIQASLFVRAHRRISLTPEGESLYEIVSVFFRDLRALSDRTAARADAAPLHIASCPNFAMQWLIPRIGEFRARHPSVEVELDTSSREVDFARTQAHAVIRSGSGDWPKVDCLALADIELVPVCTGEFLGRHPALATPRGLAEATLLHSGSRPDDWRTWLDATGTPGVDPGASIRFENGSMALQAAASGLGVAIAAKVLVEADLRSGRMIDLFGHAVPARDKYYFITPRGHTSSSLKLYRDWMSSSMASGLAALH